MILTIPRRCLVVLIGPTGSGKSTFARRHFRPTEVVSSDDCRALVSDDPNNQLATADAFDLVHLIVDRRLARGRLTVVDATNVRASARSALIRLARTHHVEPIALVFDLPESLLLDRAQTRTDRRIEADVVHRHREQLSRSMTDLPREGFDRIVTLSSVDQVEAISVSRVPLACDRRGDRGPFDLIGDVHGCADELEQLLDRLGYEVVSQSIEPAWPGPIYEHPEGRIAVFVGDLVDRGPRILDTVRIVRNMTARGSGLCVIGNHDDKFLRKLRGRNVRVAHGLEQTLAELDLLPWGIRETTVEGVIDFFGSMTHHYVLDRGRLIVAHAGLPKPMHGRDTPGVRGFALYGETTGEVDQYGLPVRLKWAKNYHSPALVVYGHTPVPEPEWIRRSVNLDTGCVFGGHLTALRYPELELISVPAAREYYASRRPFRTAQQPVSPSPNLPDPTETPPRSGA
ncbi:AAA family ATPase [Tautonia rosea]|uniref:AAA family ATPase n=1 Tax=Tautonia rosea TaxID=2728037 RepID=UPI0014746680|nr:AAA family ATPase [Tautonia rosea]